MMRFLIKVIFVLFVPVLAAEHSYGAATEHAGWTDAIGEAIADDTRTLSEVKQEALSKARSQAVEKAIGIKVQGETIVRDFALQSDFAASIASGTILDEKIIKWETDIVKNNDGSSPVPIYRVYLQARVAVESDAFDPSFKINATLNRTVFKDNDDVVLQVKSTKDCYLTVFVITEDNHAYLILPNRHKKSNQLKEGEVFTYPSEQDRVRGLTLKAGLLPGSRRAKETFRIIATKKPIHFTPDVFAEGVGLDSFKKETATLNELVRELILIPRNERAETFLAYEIVK